MNRLARGRSTRRLLADLAAFPAPPRRPATATLHAPVRVVLGSRARVLHLPPAAVCAAYTLLRASARALLRAPRLELLMVRRQQDALWLRWRVVGTARLSRRDVSVDGTLAAAFHAVSGRIDALRLSSLHPPPPARTLPAWIAVLLGRRRLVVRDASS